MDTGKIEIDAKKIVENLVVSIIVKGLTTMKIRLFVAKFLIALACKIGGLSFELKTKEEKK